MDEKKTKIKTSAFTPGMFLTDAESEAEYLIASIEEDDGDGMVISAALEVLAQKHGLTEDQNYMSLHRNLIESGSVNLTKTLLILRSMGITLAADRKSSGHAVEW